MRIHTWPIAVKLAVTAIGISAAVLSPIVVLAATTSWGPLLWFLAPAALLCGHFTDTPHEFYCELIERHTTGRS